MMMFCSPNIIQIPFATETQKLQPQNFLLQEVDAQDVKVSLLMTPCPRTPKTPPKSPN